MLGNPLNANTKIELLKLMIKNVFNEKRLFENMTYFNDIETIIYICLWFFTIKSTNAKNDKEFDNAFLPWYFSTTFVQTWSGKPNIKSSYILSYSV